MKIKPEETIQIQGPYGEINGILTPCIEENTAAPVLVLAHGFRGSMDGGGRAAVLAEMASECCNVIRFNFNGSQILSKQVEELEAVLAYVRIKFSAGKIFLLGRSLGGAAALVAASRSADITGLVLWAAPNDLQATFRNALGAEAYNALSHYDSQTLFQSAYSDSLQLQPLHPYNLHFPYIHVKPMGLFHPPVP